MRKKIIITGNLGYIGTVLTPMLSKKYNVIGIDTGYFRACYIGKKKEKKLYRQKIQDIKNIKKRDLKNVYAVINLAALSNDPLGELRKKITYETNYKSTVKLAKLCKENSVKKFIYISTQSIYGISKSNSELKENSFAYPITAYAKSKFMAEKKIKKMSDDKFHVVIFRPATVFGPSNSFRSDIVLNNFVCSAITRGKIEIHSDGTPWRPVLHINDLCNVIIIALKKNLKKINGEIFNVGVKNKNFTILQLAKLVKKNIKNTRIEFSKNIKKDQRTYKVCFNKLYKFFGKSIIAKNKINKQIKELVIFLKKNNLSKKDFLSKKTNRILQLKTIFK
jgi:nucleoside-diphosphate-sugar epimerase